MKKIFLLTLTMGLSMHLLAQIQNPSFECINIDSSICHWGSDLMFAVAIDSNGVLIGDSVVFDQGSMIGSSLDAFTGTRAMELRNAWNFTQNKGYAGRALNSADSIFSTYQSVISLTSKPLEFSFFYKYFPIGGDTAQAILTVFDSAMTQIGESKIMIPAGATNYSLAHNTVSYSSMALPALATLRFSTAMNQVHFGTRFIIDEVSFSNPLSIRNLEPENNLALYPNPVKDKLHLAEADGAMVQLFNSMGQMVLSTKNKSIIAVEHLPKGVYYLKINRNGISQASIFLKE